MMWMRRAPIAMRIPISRVRSVTDTSMMFMMPMPPTSSEIDATDNSSIVITCVALSDACRDFAEIAHGEVVVLLRLDMMPLDAACAVICAIALSTWSEPLALTNIAFTTPVIFGALPNGLAASVLEL